MHEFGCSLPTARKLVPEAASRYRRHVSAEFDGPGNGIAGLQRLMDIEEIAQLKARYFRFIDTKDWVAFQDLFTDDCRHHLP